MAKTRWRLNRKDGSSGTGRGVAGYHSDSSEAEEKTGMGNDYDEATTMVLIDLLPVLFECHLNIEIEIASAYTPAARLTDTSRLFSSARAIDEAT